MEVELKKANYTTTMKAPKSIYNTTHTDLDIKAGDGTKAKKDAAKKETVKKNKTSKAVRDKNWKELKEKIIPKKPRKPIYPEFRDPIDPLPVNPKEKAAIKEWQSKHMVRDECDEMEEEMEAEEIK